VLEQIGSGLETPASRHSISWSYVRMQEKHGILH
jgi:hypothetical protein